ncbi:hypothetical protein KZX46_20970 (plasmid) [Polymorphobacter sp. PAMC 29334]|uniref:hypothetical protein n=1 Tax=Polymorphobacter sp. PAMC 29334 TaxID=2862331 RepID=UPI001C794FA6|nr:hypothetical protein [Polymorphobacter sp. PAMC 29334]QYE37031.1 hypothetical protein KZX46_20970 [Polymorphobacter sp. PAMC 29334]
MDFISRLKKEMTEGIVRALLEDAGYRVIDLGIEKVVRELTCLTAAEYSDLGYPSAMRDLPDFTVMTRDQSVKYLVEIKYRQTWSAALFAEVRPQVETYGKLVLVSINARAPNPRKLPDSPSRFLRCCSLRMRDRQYEIELREGGWCAVDKLRDDEKLWWKMTPLYEVFTQMVENRADNTLSAAIGAITGILATTEST